MKKKAPQWLRGVLLRECYFEPTFHKHHAKLCHGFQFHTDLEQYDPARFKPFRIIALMLKCIRELYPNYSHLPKFHLRIHRRKTRLRRNQWRSRSAPLD